MNKQYTVMEYLYRDAGNYKAWGELLLDGLVDERNEILIREFLDSSEFFIPEKAGIPALRSKLYKYSNGPTEADHVFHELVSFRLAENADVERLPVWGTVSELIDKFRKLARISA